VEWSIYIVCGGVSFSYHLIELTSFMVDGPKVPVPCVKPYGARIVEKCANWNLEIAAAVAEP
jgi:hypothetical protein